MEKVQEWYMERKKMSNDWIIEVQGTDGWWKAYAYADNDEADAREKAAKACLKASQIYMVRFRRDIR